MKFLALTSAIALVAAIIFLVLIRDNPEPPETPSDPNSATEAEAPIADSSQEPEPEPEPEPDSTIADNDPQKSTDATEQEYVPAPPTHNYYSKREKTRDGTGKYYQDREISYVMGHPAINWLERPEREDEEAPAKAMDLLDLKETDVLADIGAGSGYYSLRIAMQNPKSAVIGVDIQKEMIAFLEQRITQLDVENVTTHLGKIDTIDLPPESIDAALMVDAYHEFSHPYEMMTSIVKALRPGGRVFLLEYRAEDPTVPIKPLHKMTQGQAKKEMALVGLKWEKTRDELPWQHFMVFRKP
tara:strand:+ start:9677 stop:10573 length:897 start_codon:yes stop_codon:yes gene_type:complete